MIRRLHDAALSVHLRATSERMNQDLVFTRKQIIQKCDVALVRALEEK